MLRAGFHRHRHRESPGTLSCRLLLWKPGLWARRPLALRPFLLLVSVAEHQHSSPTVGALTAGHPLNEGGRVFGPQRSSPSGKLQQGTPRAPRQDAEPMGFGKTASILSGAICETHKSQVLNGRPMTLSRTWGGAGEWRGPRAHLAENGELSFDRKLRLAMTHSPA